MRMDQNIQGQSVLCVMASPDAITDSTSLNRFGFEGPTALILEDLDLWDLPWMDFGSGDISDFLQMQLSRGAREAMAFIQQAIENPEVTVLVSASNLDALDTFFGPMLGSTAWSNSTIPTTKSARISGVMRRRSILPCAGLMFLSSFRSPRGCRASSCMRSSPSRSKSLSPQRGEGLLLRGAN